jgi:hypothetical protein
LVEEVYPDATPRWWPLNRPDTPWSAEERRSVFSARLLERLPAGFPPEVWTQSDVRRPLNVMRGLALWVDSEENQVLELP